MFAFVRRKLLGRKAVADDLFSLWMDLLVYVFSSHFLVWLACVVLSCLPCLCAAMELSTGIKRSNLPPALRARIAGFLDPRGKVDGFPVPARYGAD